LWGERITTYDRKWKRVNISELLKKLQLKKYWILARHSRGEPAPAKAWGGNPEHDIMDKQFYVYILASKRNGTLYIAVTSDLIQRIWQHKNKMAKGFAQKYNVNKLVYYEVHLNAESAITKEKQMKKWQRAWKLQLIEEKNPDWKDLYDDIRL